MCREKAHQDGQHVQEESVPCAVQANTQWFAPDIAPTLIQTRLCLQDQERPGPATNTPGALQGPSEPDANIRPSFNDSNTFPFPRQKKHLTATRTGRV
jgi:hypothetical protein